MRDRILLLVAPVAFTLLVFAVPVGFLIAHGFNDPVWGFQNFRALRDEPVYFGLMRNTVMVSLEASVLSLLLGYPMAHVMAHCPRLTRLLTFIVLVPFWSCILVRSFAWMVLLQNNGLINRLLLDSGIITSPVEMIFNRTGVLIGLVQVLVPFVIFPLYSSMRAIDPTLVPAAYCLGATPVRASCACNCRC